MLQDNFVATLGKSLRDHWQVPCFSNLDADTITYGDTAHRIFRLHHIFQEAGVKSVLNSLWPVSDEGTRLLMVGFYNEMLAGKTVREALKASQLAMLKGDEWNHPYYWAAFVVVGRK